MVVLRRARYRSRILQPMSVNGRFEFVDYQNGLFRIVSIPMATYYTLIHRLAGRYTVT